MRCRLARARAEAHPSFPALQVGRITTVHSALHSDSPTWLGDPWHAAALVTVRDVKFANDAPSMKQLRKFMRTVCPPRLLCIHRARSHARAGYAAQELSTFYKTAEEQKEVAHKAKVAQEAADRAKEQLEKATKEAADKDAKEKEVKRKVIEAKKKKDAEEWKKADDRRKKKDEKREKALKKLADELKQLREELRKAAEEKLKKALEAKKEKHGKAAEHERRRVSWRHPAQPSGQTTRTDMCVCDRTR
jgi:hypothetical protein